MIINQEIRRRKQLELISTEHRTWLNHLFGWEFVANNPSVYRMTWLSIERLLLLRIESLRMDKARKVKDEEAKARALLDKLKMG